MNIKKIFILIMFISLFSLSLFLVSCKRIDAKVVGQVPSGFVNLAKEEDYWENGLHYYFWETQISFFDADEVCIYQTSVTDSDFIVKYKNEYYANEEKLLELMDIAAISPEQRCKLYSLEDAVEIRGAGEIVYTVKITDLKVIETDSVTTYNIKYTVTSNVIENEQKKFFSLVETKDGLSTNMFDFIDTETVSVQMRASRKIGAIVLSSPEYSGLIYRIVVD